MRKQGCRAVAYSKKRENDLRTRMQSKCLELEETIRGEGTRIQSSY